MKELETGAILTSGSGIVYRVLSCMGVYSTGKAYEVETDGGRYTLKWDYETCRTKEKTELLSQMIMQGAPDMRFLWPLDMICGEDGQTAGSILPLIPKRYRCSTALLKGTINPSLYVLCRVAYGLADGYRHLHAEGWYDEALDMGSLFFDPDNGDVLICCDNIVPDGNRRGNIGTMGFIAPEIVRGEALPSKNTEQYALAVVLFYLFMKGHPLEGKREYDIHCKDMAAMTWLYGENPVFIYDPDNTTNRPVKGWNDAVMYWWSVYPKELQDMFTYSFTTGIKKPHARVTEGQWMNLLANLMSSIQQCPKCQRGVFYDPSKKAGEKYICWNCGREVPMSSILEIDKKSRVLLNRKSVICSHQINGDGDMDTVVGRMVQNPANPKIWGIRNETKQNWTYILPDGRNELIPPGRSAVLRVGAGINFGTKTGKFR